jgi:hypothetical protein
VSQRFLGLFCREPHLFWINTLWLGVEVEFGWQIGV